MTAEYGRIRAAKMFGIIFLGGTKLFHLSITRHVGGRSSGMCHLLPQWWQLCISGRRSLPQFSQVTCVILGWVSIYVIKALIPKHIVPRVHQNLARLDKPIMPASTLNRHAKNTPNKIDGNITASERKKPPISFTLALLSIISIKELYGIKKLLRL